MGSIEFGSQDGKAFAHLGEAYSGGFSMDEQVAYLVSAATYVKEAERALANGNRHSDRLRAAANFILAESTLKSSAGMAEANKQNLLKVKEALSKGEGLRYDPATGTASLAVRDPQSGRPFIVRSQLPTGIEDERAAASIFNDLIDTSIARTEKVAKESYAKVEKSYAAALAKLETPDPDIALKGRGVPVYTAKQIEEAAPAVKAAARYYEAAEEELASARRRVLAGKATFDEYEKAAASVPRLGAHVPAGDEGAKRLALLRQEETFLARRVARLEAEVEEARLAKNRPALVAASKALKEAELEHAGFAALALGQSQARRAAPRGIEARKAALSGIGEAEFLRHQERFPGKTLRDVLADPAESKLLSALARADAIDEAKYLEDARRRLERSLATHVAKGNGKEAGLLAQALIAESGVRPGAMKLADRGWPKEMVDACPPAICRPTVDVKNPPTGTRSLVAREALLDSELAAAGPRTRAEATAMVRDVPDADPKQVLRRAEEAEARLAQEASLLAKQPGSEGALAEVRRAQEAFAAKKEAIGRESAAIAKAAPLDTEGVSLRNSMAAEVMRTLRTLSDDELAAIHPSLAGQSHAGVLDGTERLQLYKDFKAAMSEATVAERAEVFAAVKGALADRPGLGQLREANSGVDALTGAFRRVDNLAEKGGAADPALTRAIYKDAKLSPEEAALADALGMAKASTPSGLERRAEIVAAERSLNDNLGRMAGEASPPAAAGRAPASLESVPGKLDGEAVASVMKRELADSTLGKEVNEAFAAQAKLLEAGRTEAEVFGLARAMKGLSQNPDLFESMRVSYENAFKAKQADQKLTREQAMTKGVRKMLDDLGFKGAELDGMTDRTMASLACMRL